MTETTEDLPASLWRFEYAIAEEGVALVSVAGSWNEGTDDPRPALTLRVSGPAGGRRLLPLPSWGSFSPDEAGIGDEWRIGLRVATQVVEDGGSSFALEIGTTHVVQLARPVPRGQPAPGRVIVGALRLPARIVSADDWTSLESRLIELSEAAEARDQSGEMIAAVEAQNRALRAGLAELEDALARANHAAAIAAQLQAVVESDARVARAGAELDAARHALRKSIFDDDNEGMEAMVQIAAREREAREALEAEPARLAAGDEQHVLDGPQGS